MKFVTGKTETGRLELAQLKTGAYFGQTVQDGKEKRHTATGSYRIRTCFPEQRPNYITEERKRQPQKAVFRWERKESFRYCLHAVNRQIGICRANRKSIVGDGFPVPPHTSL